MYKYYPPDPELGKVFSAAEKELQQVAEKELQQVAEKYGFSLRLVDNSKGTWYFYPEIEEQD